MNKDEIELREYDDTSPQDTLLPSNSSTSSSSLPIPPDWRTSSLLRAQILTCFYFFIVVGLNDQIVGNLIPVLTDHYNISKVQISMVFILQFFGYGLSAVTNGWLHRNLGKFGVIVLSNCCLLLTYLIISFKPPVFIFIMVYFGSGVGVGLIDSCTNVWLSTLRDHNELMGLLHGFYGVGSFIQPVLISHLLEKVNGDFKWVYIIMTLLSFISVCLSLFFKNEGKVVHVEQEDDQKPKIYGVMDALREPLVIYSALYLFLYIGVEVSIGSWLLTYLMEVKTMPHIDASFIVSWFWIGLTLGRFILGFTTKFFPNEYTANLAYSITSLILYLSYSLTTLFTTHLTILLITLAGIFIGPLFPTSNITLVKNLSPEKHIVSVGLMNSIGGSGAAILPFLVGVIAKWISMKWLHLLISSLMAGYVIVWIRCAWLVKSK